MIVELGHFVLLLSFGLSILQGGLLFRCTVNPNAPEAKLVKSAAIVSFILILASFLALTWSYWVSDFSVLNVYENSHSDKPSIYKISGVWGNHEGSMLLWLTILHAFSAAMAAAKPQTAAQQTYTLALSVQGWLQAATAAFIIFTSNPFTRLIDAPLEGKDLNPILQDPGLAIHPPLLYLGYVGFSAAFSFAIAALLRDGVDKSWARIVRPWVLLAWAFLTLGIAIGSYWAYYELGWGGFWFWDPVENASLMPWLIGTALMHSIAVLEKRDSLKIWTIILALSAFLMSLIGTFLVRSGVLNSVHAFANDPARGLFILLLVAFFTLVSFMLFAWRVPSLTQGKTFTPISREGALVANNLLLTAAASAVFVGTLYPLFLEAIADRKISVGAPYFNATVLPFLLPIALMVPFGQSLAWRKGNLLPLLKRLWLLLGVSIIIAALYAYPFSMKHLISVLAVALGLFAILGAMDEIRVRLMLGQSTSARIARLKKLSPSVWGMVLAHAGVGVSMIGIAASVWATETLQNMKQGETIAASSYTLRLDAATSEKGPNFDALTAHFTVFYADKPIAKTTTSRRLYEARQMPTTEVGLLTRGFSQVYVVMGEIADDETLAVRLYHKPLVLLIWAGALIMALGGALAWFDRRKQSGANENLKMASS
jgi:cytochrome c-type biogenesis protein CcmF